jgi:hypothetical protein
MRVSVNRSIHSAVQRRAARKEVRDMWLRLFGPKTLVLTPADRMLITGTRAVAAPPKTSARCHKETLGRSIGIASQDIDHFALRYPPLRARFEHAIDLGPECSQPGNFVLDGDEMRFGYGIDGCAGLIGSAS